MSKLTAYDKFVQQALKYGFSLFGLPPSEQTTVFRTGDDGTYQKGYPRTGARFIDNGDGTVTDIATGLMWAGNGTGKGCNYGNKKNWNDAIDWALALDFAGHTDWRLPNIKELQSINDWGRYGPSINPTLFPNTSSDFYWSCTTLASLTTHAEWVNFYAGNTANEPKTTIYFLRAVRLGFPI